jgi:hypothetical protein
MLDSDLRPWLLEANSQPSLSASSFDDYTLKCQLIDDTLRVLDLEGHGTELDADEMKGTRDDSSEISVGGFDVIWNKGPVIPDMKSKSFLGCKNNSSRPLETIVNKDFIEKRQREW